MSKSAVYLISFLFLYFILPISLSLKQQFPAVRYLVLFYFTNLLIAAYLFKRNSDKKYRIGYQIQELQEKLNVIADQNMKDRQSTRALQEKITRYNSLKEIIEEINKNLDLDAVTNSLAEIAFSVISNNRGICVLYLVDNQSQRLTLFKTKKEDRNFIIRAKEGDIFDLWVSRHASPLLIEDIKRDFRFDLERLKEEDERRVGSLISSPFTSGDKFLGLLRLDNKVPHFYSQDDLRFLVTLCELGAVAIENGQLFKHTQELAIHDALTGLFTKGHFLDRLKEEFSRSMRKKTNFSLLMLDIDLFKNYNDKFGHTAGDTVLKKLSQVLVESLAEFNPVISRFGGEEFCIILLGMQKKSAIEAANMLRERIEREKIILRRQETNITVSMGIASFPEDTTTEDELIHKADKAMYAAKQKGRNRVCST